MNILLAAENETFETVDPVTQAPLANIARGKSVDIDRAVSAARGVFERGDWSLSSPAKRKAVLNKLADLMEANAEELALLGNARHRQTDSSQPA